MPFFIQKMFIRESWDDGNLMNVFNLRIERVLYTKSHEYKSDDDVENIEGCR